MAARDIIKNQSAAQVTTSSTSYQDALTATGTPTSGLKDFWVLCSAILDKAGTTTDVNAKLIDSTGAVDLCVWNIEPKDTTDFTAVFGLAKWTSPVSPVSQSFKLQYSTETSGTVGIDETCIVAIESHASDQYAGTDAETTTTSGTPQDVQTLTFTPTTQGDYLIIAYGEANASSSTFPYVRLDVDGTDTHIMDPADLSDASNYFPWVAVHKVNLTAVSHTIKIQLASDGVVTARIRRRRILAIRLDTITANSADYTAARGSTTSTTPQDAASTTFTAAGSVDYFAISNVLMDCVSTTVSNNARMLMDGAAVALHTRESISLTAERMYAAINYSAFAAGSRTIKTQVYSETAGTTTGYQYRGIYVLDLREATGPTTYEVSISETVSLTDAATGTLVLPAAISETVGLADAATGAITLAGALSEAVGLSDASSALMLFAGDIAEALALADPATGTLVMDAAIGEALGLTDGTAGGFTLLESLSETLSVADAVAAGLTMPGAIAEAVAFIDAASNLAVLQAAVSEAAGLSDAATGLLDAQGAVSETVGMADGVTGNLSMPVAIAEALALADSAAANAVFNAAVVELVSVTDAASLQAALAALIAEDVSIADFMVGGKLLTGSIAETLSISDAAAAALLVLVVLAGRLRIRPAVAGDASTAPAVAAGGRTQAALAAEIETRAKIAATAARLRAALAGNANTGD